MSQQAVSAHKILNSAVEIFFPKAEEQRKKQLGYTDMVVSTDCIRSSRKVQLGAWDQEN
jgi:hypothetical protein